MKALNRASNRMTKNKPDRVPVSGLRDIMTVMNKDPAFEYRFVADKDEMGMRIHKYINGGWEFSPTEGDEGRLIVGQESVYKTRHRLYHRDAPAYPP